MLFCKNVIYYSLYRCYSQVPLLKLRQTVYSSLAVFNQLKSCFMFYKKKHKRQHGLNKVMFPRVHMNKEQCDVSDIVTFFLFVEVYQHSNIYDIYDSCLTTAKSHKKSKVLLLFHFLECFLSFLPLQKNLQSVSLMILNWEVWILR